LPHLHRPSGIFSSLFPTKTLYAFITFRCVLLPPPPSIRKQLIIPIT
jgi:hypothetical protein